MAIPAAPPLPYRPAPTRLPPRLLRLASDERLVELVRLGSEPAFEVIFDRHHRALLGFCRHMLGSVEEAEDAVQHTFTAAYSSLLDSDRTIELRPWLYTIARNRCLTLLRARRERPVEEVPEPATEHLAAQVLAPLHLGGEVLRGRLVHLAQRPLPTGAEHGEAAVAGDRVKPRAQLNRLRRADQVPVRGHERVLDGVLRLLRGAEHVAAEREDAAVVAIVDDLEGRLGARADVVDKALVGSDAQQHGRTGPDLGARKWP